MRELPDFLCSWLTVLLLILLCAAVIVFMRKGLRAERRELELWHELALRDDLTGLFNRAAYNRKIAECQGKSRKNCWILLFDVDKLKKVNDTEGHLQGDRVLIGAGKALSETFSVPGCGVYRIGGDEFAVIAENMEQERISELLKDLEESERREGGFHISKGFAVIENGDCKGAFAAADRMLYENKAAKTANLKESG